GGPPSQGPPLAPGLLRGRVRLRRAAERAACAARSRRRPALRGEQCTGAPRWKAAANSVLLLDGVFLLRPELATWWDYSVFVTVPESVTLERGLVRDSGW